MDLVLFFGFGPPIATFFVLALLPSGKPVLIGYAVFAALMIAMGFSIYPLPPASGPDDWFHGIEQVPYIAAFVAAGVVGVAQMWRAWRLRNGKPTYYVLALVLPLILPLLYVFVGY